MKDRSQAVVHAPAGEMLFVWYYWPWWVPDIVALWKSHDMAEKYAEIEGAEIVQLDTAKARYEGKRARVYKFRLRRNEVQDVRQAA